MLSNFPLQCMCQNNVCPSKVRDKIVSNTQKVTYRKEKNNSTLSLFSLKVFVILPGKGSGIFQLYRRFLTFFVQVPQRDFCLACEAVWHSKSSYISRVVSYFCETELEIWASFGLAGNAENFCNFSKVTYFWGCFLPFLTTKTQIQN